MDKRIILAVAGSGKTTYIIDKIKENDKALIIVYTKNNYELLKSKLSEKFKGIPPNIKIFTYFSFIYTFCFRPLEGDCGIDSRGVLFKQLGKNIFKKTDGRRYMSLEGYLYSSYISEFLLVHKIDNVKDRIMKYFDYIYIDEVQDYGAYDFDLILEIAKLNINILYVGDFFQHTYDSSKAGNKNNKLYDDYSKYLKKFKKILFIDDTTLQKSYRCNPNICEYISSKLNIKINSHKINSNKIIKEIIDSTEIKNIISDDSIKKLFYLDSKKYLCSSDNWGNCKGLSYDNICVILNNTTYTHFKNNTLHNLKSQTKNKFYVACTRTKNHLYFIEEKKIKHLKK